MNVWLITFYLCFNELISWIFDILKSYNWNKTSYLFLTYFVRIILRWLNSNFDLIFAFIFFIFFFLEFSAYEWFISTWIHDSYLICSLFVLIVRYVAPRLLTKIVPKIVVPIYFLYPLNIDDFLSNINAYSLINNMILSYKLGIHFFNTLTRNFVKTVKQSEIYWNQDYTLLLGYCRNNIICL